MFIPKERELTRKAASEGDCGAYGAGSALGAQGREGLAPAAQPREPWGLPFKPLLPGIIGLLLILFLFLPSPPPSSTSLRIYLQYISEEDTALRPLVADFYGVHRFLASE